MSNTLAGAHLIDLAPTYEGRDEVVFPIVDNGGDQNEFIGPRSTNCWIVTCLRTWINQLDFTRHIEYCKSIQPEARRPANQPKSPSSQWRIRNLRKSNRF